MRLLVVIACLLSTLLAFGQNQGKGFDRPLAAVHSLAYTVNVGFGASKAKFASSETDWKHPFGYVVSGGAGISYMIKNSWGFEGDISYELNQYLYRNADVNLSLGYRAPYASARIKKVLNPGAEDSFYVKAGFGYLFGGKGTLSKIEPTYAYSLNFQSTSNGSGILVVGFQKRTSPKTYMDFGITYQYRLSDFFASNMNLIDPTTETAYSYGVTNTNGSYIGISYVYYGLFSIWSNETTWDRKYDSRF